MSKEIYKAPLPAACGIKKAPEGADYARLPPLGAWSRSGPG